MLIILGVLAHPQKNWVMLLIEVSVAVFHVHWRRGRLVAYFFFLDRRYRKKNFWATIRACMSYHVTCYFSSHFSPAFFVAGVLKKRYFLSFCVQKSMMRFPLPRNSFFRVDIFAWITDGNLCLACILQWNRENMTIEAWLLMLLPFSKYLCPPMHHHWHPLVFLIVGIM